MKKETFYKTMTKPDGKGYYLQEAKGYKKTYTDETHAQITLYFDKVGGLWSITEEQTGATVNVAYYSTLKESINYADKIALSIIKMMTLDNIREKIKTKFNLLCNMA